MDGRARASDRSTGHTDGVLGPSVVRGSAPAVGTGSTSPTDSHRAADGRPARREPGDRRYRGVEAHARLDGQRTQPQRRVGWLVQECTAGGLGKLKCSTAFVGGPRQLHVFPVQRV
jgi:hypothetical protein